MYGKGSQKLSPEDQSLLDGYLTKLQMYPNNTLRLFAVGFLGLPGSGKSTVADMIGHQFDLPVNRSDQIRRYLNEVGFSGAHPRPDIMASLAEGRTGYYYENDTSAVIDANFAEYAENSRRNAQRFGAALLLISIQCPHEIAIKRLEQRSQKAQTGDSLAVAEDYDRIKANNATFDPVEPDFDIDTTQPLDPQIQRFGEYLQSEGYID